MRPHLLPRNATPIEQAIELAIDPFDRLAAPIEYLSRVKIAAPDAILPWLIWEYGLAELLPYLPDRRQAIREGLRWQRLRGTPAALTMALSWIGMTAAVEEEEQTSEHWAEFQLDPGRVLLDAEIDPILAVARLSAPARSRLARMYHGYDHRHMRLDKSRLDDALLSDYSGIVWTDGVTRLSFGRRFDAAAAVDPDVWTARLATHLFYAQYADRCLLDVMALSGCVQLPNPRFEHGHLYEIVQRNALNDRSPIAPARKYCKAQVVPSEQWTLGDTNACLPAREWVPGDPFLLGNGLLSQVTGGHWREILERFERISRTETLGHEIVWHSTASHWRSSDAFARRVLRLGDGRLDERGGLDIFGAERTATDVVLRPETVFDVRPQRRFAAAQIVLSEQWALGSTNACTPPREWIDGETLVLSEDAVSDTPGGCYAPILERFERLISTPNPIVVTTGDVAAAAHEAGRGLSPPIPLSTPPDITDSFELTSTTTSRYSGQRWAGPWADVAWSTANTLITTHHTEES